MKKWQPNIAVGLLLSAGACVLLYPSFSAWINSRHQTRAIQEYTAAVEELDDDSIREQWTLAERYNQQFSGQNITGLGQVEVPADYHDALNPGGTGLMGYIEIPVIDVYLPIYHDTLESVLKRGVGHVPETPLPIGGEGLHPVLTGHRAMATSDLFNDLDKLVEGDVFLLQILDDTLAYQVDNITVVEPDDIQDLLPVAGKDCVSLVTCTPFAVNSHRLLVRGTRIPYDPEVPIEVREIETESVDFQRIIILAFLAPWLLLAFILLLTRRRHGDKSLGRKRRSWIWLPIVLLLLAGVGVMLYPTISKLEYAKQVERDFEEFRQRRDEVEDMNSTNPMLEKLREYNRWLYEEGQAQGLENPLAFEEANIALKELGYTQETIGYIDAKKAWIFLPIYLGASQENLNRGAAHMTWTSLPVGGENTNICIIGHRNLTRTEMFRNIDRLEPDDVVRLYMPWGDLEYRVVETAIIWPDQTGYLEIQPGRELLTLVSCYPRGSDEQRYLVICERMD